jgi:flagellar protein FlaG
VSADASKVVAQSARVMQDATAIAEKAEKNRELSDKRIEEAVRRLNEQMKETQTKLGFSVDNQTDRLIVKVTNKETGELVRQIPAEAVVKVAQSIESLKGVLFDKEF